MAVGDQLLYPVQGDDGEAGTFALAGQVEGQEVFVGVEAGHLGRIGQDGGGGDDKTAHGDRVAACVVGSGRRRHRWRRGCSVCVVIGGDQLFDFGESGFAGGAQLGIVGFLRVPE